MDKLYRKIESYSGRAKYEEVPMSDWRGFPCDGVWLVQARPNVESSECILKLGELQDLYPYAQMAQNVDDLASFIIRWKEEQRQKTGKYENGQLVSYCEPSAMEFARDILKFLAGLSKKELYFFKKTCNILMKNFG